jgi:hypothetical protein
MRFRPDLRPSVRPGVVLRTLALIAAAAMTGCHQDMYQQQKYKTYTPNAFYADSLSARPLVEGTVVHHSVPASDVMTTGLENGKPAAAFPMPVTRSLILRGQNRFDIFCAPCHGRLGDGNGIVVQRGFPAPPSFHTDSVRSQPPGFYVDVITRGFGRMYPYAARVHPDDRWAIAAYIRALQLSQHAPVASLPEAQRKNIESR